MNFMLSMLSTPGNGDVLGENFKSFFYNNLWGYVKTGLIVLIVLLAIVFIVKAITTAMAVMKAADEPQVRQEKIGAFKYLAIGLGIAIVVMSLATVIVEKLLASATAISAPTSGTSFLF